MGPLTLDPYRSLSRRVRHCECLMPEVPAPCILSVGHEPPPDSPRASYVFAPTGGRALELMKLLRFDLIVATPGGIDLSVPILVRQMRAISPWQKWALVGPDISDQDELAARCNGALAVLDDRGDWSEFEQMAANVRRRNGRTLAAQA